MSSTTNPQLATDLSPSEAAAKMLEILGRATEGIGSTLDIEMTRTRALQIPLPLLADWTALFVIDRQGKVQLVGCQHKDTLAKDALEKEILINTDSFVKTAKFEDVIRRGQAHASQLSEISWSAPWNNGPLLSLPIKARNEISGILCLGKHQGFLFDSSDVVIGEELTARLAIALENARLYQHAKQVESELTEAKLIAERASQAKTTFLAAMSHEIRTPLTAILGFSELLLTQETKPEEQIDWAQRIRQNGRRLLRLIDDILNVSKIESGKIEVHLQETSLSTLLLDLIDNHQIAAVEKNLGFKISFLSPVPEILITDSIRLYQILSNLIGNAIKFTDAGKVDVIFDYERISGDLRVMVDDTGPGLTMDQAALLFEPFSQADTEHARRSGGTGLGLMLSRHLARRLGGDVDIVSTRPGYGSRFQLIVPVGKSEGKFHASWQNSIANQPLPEDRSLTRLAGKTILIVDDSDDNRVLIHRVLKTAGAEVIEANDGKEALETLSVVTVDAVVMDIQMPGLDGISATRELRKRGFEKPIIMLTAHALPDERDRSRDAGCNAHLSKPVIRDDMVRTLAEWIDATSNSYGEAKFPSSLSSSSIR